MYVMAKTIEVRVLCCKCVANNEKFYSYQPRTTKAILKLQPHNDQNHQQQWGHQEDLLMR